MIVTVTHGNLGGVLDQLVTIPEFTVDNDQLGFNPYIAPASRMLAQDRFG